MARMHSCAIPALGLLMLLASCASAPLATQICPQLPPPPAPVPTELNYQLMMQDFLHGLLPNPQDSKYSLTPAKSASSPTQTR